MTSNQVAYLKQREDYRHNLAQERELSRANLAQESLTRQQQEINREANAINLKLANERERANRAIERNTRRGQDIQAAYNGAYLTHLSNQRRISERQNEIANLSSQRSASASRYATSMNFLSSSRANEISARNAAANSLNASTNRLSAENAYDLGLRKAANERSMLSSQIEVNRSSAARNRASASLSRSQQSMLPYNTGSNIISSIGSLLGGVARSAMILK